MKKSEMVNILLEEINSRQYQDYEFVYDDVEQILDVLVTNGMLPPEDADFNIGNNWEPEKWAVEYECSKQLNGINTSEVIHDEAATLNWEKLLTAKEKLSNIE